MKSSTRSRTVAWMLAAIAVTPLAAAAETEVLETDVGSTVALKDGRADVMSVWSVDSGGGESSHGGLTLVATAGQHDAGVVSEGGFALAGGLWAGEVDLGLIFSDGFESNDTDAWSSVVGSAP